MSIAKNSFNNEDFSGLLWITGYSGAGKTTVGRHVDKLLKAKGVPTIFLDGDDLRSIFGGHFGYEREERIKLAKIYIRLCSHLAAQNYTVVLPAVALYDEISEWMRLILPRSVQVYLNVSEDERVLRDSETKGIYKNNIDMSLMYDEPINADLVLDNSSSASPEAVANRIVDYYLSKSEVNDDIGRKEHWDGYYGKSEIPEEPSSFAQLVNSLIEKNSNLLEVGCGNGRDCSYFSREGHLVKALDASKEAINLCKEKYHGLHIDFYNQLVDELESSFSEKFDVVYSRFVLHAMTPDEEASALNSIIKILKSGGHLFIECRSINDPLARKGEVISPTERIFGHYRRFIVLSDLMGQLEALGFEVITSTEESGLSALGDDDPVLARIHCKKK